MALDVAVQMDPVEGINIETDTTFMLMLEAQTRGHGLWVYTPDRIGARGRAGARRGAAAGAASRSRATTTSSAPSKRATSPRSTWS